jgi:hypothetical protein
MWSVTEGEAVMGLQIRRGVGRWFRVAGLAIVFALITLPLFASTFPIVHAVSNNPPSVPTGGQPHDTYHNMKSFDFTWDESTDTEGEKVTYQFRSSKDISQVGGAPDTSNAWYSGTLDSPSIHSSGAEDGVWYWQVRAIDEAGLKSAWSDTWKMTLDTGKPTLDVKRPADATVFGGSDSRYIVVEAFLEDELGLGKYHIDIEGQAAMGGGVQSATTSAQEVACPGSAGAEGVNLTVCTVYDATDFLNGTYTITTWVEDKAENRTTATRTIEIVDTAAPVLSTPTNDGDVLGGMVPITLHAEEANPRIYNIRILDTNDQVVVGKNGENQGKYDPNNSSTTFVCDWDTANVNDGQYKLEFHATDASGNAATIYRTVTVDNAPKPPIVTITGQQDRTVTGTVTIASADLKVFIDGTERSDIAINRSGNDWSLVLPEDITGGVLRIVATSPGGSDAKELTLAGLERPTPEGEEDGSDSVGQVTDDPVLAELAASLSQPFTVPASFNFPIGSTEADISTDSPSSDVLGIETAKSPRVDQVGKTPAAIISNDGWKLMGVAWYWWTLLLGGLIIILWRILAGRAHRDMARDAL